MLPFTLAVTCVQGNLSDFSNTGATHYVCELDSPTPPGWYNPLTDKLNKVRAHSLEGLHHCKTHGTLVWPTLLHLCGLHPRSVCTQRGTLVWTKLLQKTQAARAVALVWATPSQGGTLV